MKRFCQKCHRKIEKVGFSKQVICNPCKLQMLKEQKTMPEEIKEEEVVAEEEPEEEAEE
jgi:hypothetical protein